MESTKLMIHPPVWLALLVALILGGLYVEGKRIEVRGYQRAMISVEAEGKVKAPPNIAVMSFGVTTGRQKTAPLAMDTLSKQMADIVSAVKAQGVEDKDIATQSLWLSPSYDYTEKEGRVDRGFEASQNLQVKVRDLSKIGSVLNVAVSKGANQAGDISFTIDDPDSLRKQAREMAISKAKEKAEILAQQLGRPLGELRGFNEGSVGYPVNYMQKTALAMPEADSSGASPVVPTGEQEVSITVTLTYELQ